MDKIGVTEITVVIKYYYDHTAEEEFYDNIKVYTNDMNTLPTTITGIIEGAKESMLDSPVHMIEGSLDIEDGDEDQCQPKEIHQY